jgi:hypothetical protein
LYRRDCLAIVVVVKELPPFFIIVTDPDGVDVDVVVIIVPWTMSSGNGGMSVILYR